MTSGLYCSGCKRIVWHPYVQDVDYYLNERHPRHESDCLYHDGGSEYPGSSTSGTDSYAGIFKGNGTSTRIQGGKKKTNREKKTADPFQNMGNRMTGQRNAFEHMKSQLEQYRGQADTCQNGAYSSDEEAFYQIVDVLEATFQEFGYLDTDLSGQEVYQELINTEDMIVSKTDDSVNGFTTAYGPEIFASKESPSGDDFYSIQMYAPGYYTSVE